MVRIRNKDIRKEVVRLCRSHNLEMVRGKRGVKLYKDGRFVGCIHQTISDSKHALENLLHELENRL